MKFHSFSQVRYEFLFIGAVLNLTFFHRSGMQYLSYLTWVYNILGHICFQILLHQLNSHHIIDIPFTSQLWKSFHTTAMNFFHIRSMKTFSQYSYDFLFTSSLWKPLNSTAMIFFHIISMKALLHNNFEYLPVTVKANLMLRIKCTSN